MKLAQSGTGKTATFSLSILQTINTTQRETQALVLSPTRELATQIQSVILALGEYLNVEEPPPPPDTQSPNIALRSNATLVSAAPTLGKISASLITANTSSPVRPAASLT